MAVVERIVSEHDGDVEAANRPEGGVRIRIRVPPADPAGEA
jgi:K+-sensing histidine kinase KdpD